MSNPTNTTKPTTALGRAIAANNKASSALAETISLRIDMEDLHARNMISFTASMIGLALSIASILIVCFR
jgi:hypothetical protein